MISRPGPVLPGMNTTNAPTARAGRREWIALAVIALPCLLYSTDLSVLHLAVPSLTVGLHPGGTQMLWVSDIYGFTLASSPETMNHRFRRENLIDAEENQNDTRGLLLAGSPCRRDVAQ